MLTGSVELQGTEEARTEAAKPVGDLLKEHSSQLWADWEWRVDVTDEVGLILFVINISAQKTSATMDK